jgi:hypothetical protein
MFTHGLGDERPEEWVDLGTPPGIRFTEPTQSALLLQGGAAAPDIMVSNDQEVWKRPRYADWTRFGTPGGDGKIDGLCACQPGTGAAYVFVTKFYPGSQTCRLWLGRRSDNVNDTAQWTDLGNPTGQGLELVPTGACVDNAGTVRLFLRPISNDISAVHIWVVSGKDNTFQWEDLGTPAGKTVILCYGAIMIDGVSPAVTIRASDEHVWMNQWDTTKNSWQWTDVGTPASF